MYKYFSYIFIYIDITKHTSCHPLPIIKILRVLSGANSEKKCVTARGASQKPVQLSDPHPRRCQFYDIIFSVFYRYKCSSDICGDG